MKTTIEVVGHTILDGLVSANQKLGFYASNQDFVLGWQRYEKVRKLNPAQFADLWKENLTTGVHFDILVDQLPE